jgi:thiamine biosynthesis lipoprotein
MGTSCVLAAAAEPGQQAHAEGALREAEAAVRAVEIRMSRWLADSEISRLNAAEAGEHVPLSAETFEVLRAARDAHVRSKGAFDVTCAPVIELWRDALARGELPSEGELAQARAASGWQQIELTRVAAVKRHAAARVDLGGIAKGYAIDRAAEILRQAGLAGGLVDIGGDLLCFGKPPTGDAWTVDVQDPFAEGCFARLRLPDGGAVCTSGNYARFREIAGKRYSHILDPRTLRPADAAASVTVVAADAVTADVWATALSVLGPEGFDRLPEGVEAMLVTGTGSDFEVHGTPGLGSLLEEGPTYAPGADAR